MKISIITACFNNEKTIRDSLESVKAQSYPDIEHIIVDGASKDRTIEIVNEYPHVSKVISEADKGIYDALNKGLENANGDVIGFLHSDDYFYSDQIIEEVVKHFKQNEAVDCVFGDIVFVNEKNDVIRYYSSKQWNPNKFRYGRMPAHTSFFAKKKVYNKHLFNLNYKIAGDFEQLIRILYTDKTPYKYTGIITTSMRPGGASTDGLKSNLTINKEIKKACREHGIYTNYFMIYSKYLKKIFEFIRKS